MGRIGAAHGVKGEVRLVSFTAEPKAIAAYGALSDARGARIEILALRHVRDNIFVARLQDISTRAAAEALNGTELYMARAALPEPAEDEYYHADLIGLAAHSADGARIGEVTGVLNFGGGDILEIAPEGGGETLLLPFTKTVVPRVDLEGGAIVVAPPAEIEAQSAQQPASSSAPAG